MRFAPRVKVWFLSTWEGTSHLPHCCGPIMLIIAIPKSASTSLLDTLGKLHSLEAKQILLRDQPAPENLRLLHCYHSDMREITADHAALFAHGQKLFKQHIPPSPGNIGLLTGTKKVVLLRHPEQIIEAYCRAEAKGLHQPRVEFSDCKTPEEWKAKAAENGLLGDLQWFHDQWTAEAAAHPEEILTLGFEELVENSEESLNRVEAHFGLPVSERVKLSKVRYSGNSRFYIQSVKALKKLKKIPVLRRIIPDNIVDLK